MSKMDFYYENEAEQFVFYRVPKMLFKDKRFSKISSDAKLLYALFLDRMSLSKKNGWVDEEKRVYIYFSIQEIMEELGVASEKCTKIMAELDDVKGCGLIHKKRQGQGKPVKIYVMKYTSVNDEDEKSENTEEKQLPDIDWDNYFKEYEDEEYVKYLEGFIVEGTLDYPKIIRIDNPLPKPPKIEKQDFRNSKNKSFENRNSKLSENEIQDFRYSKCNDNKYINTENNENDYNNINPILSYQENGRKDFKEAIEERKRYEEIVKENIDYDILKDRHPDVDIDGMVEIMLDAICSKRGYLNINREDVPQALVKSRLLKLDAGHIEYAIECLDKNTTKIGNIRSYMLTTLYNSYTTQDHICEQRLIMTYTDS